MSKIAIRLRIEPLRSLGFASIGAAYMGIGTPIDHEARQILIQNLTNATLLFSDDGVEDKFPLAAGTSFINDISSNQTGIEGFFMSKGTRWYVKESGTPTSGAVYLTVFYGSDS